MPGTSASGGAIDAGVLAGGLADLRDVVFANNTTIAGFAFGGAVSGQASGSGSRFQCTRCNFVSNLVASQNGGANGYGGAIKFNTSSSGVMSVRDSRFVSNAASAGTGGEARNVLTADASSGSTIELERLFIDANQGPTDSSSLDVFLSADSGASVWLLNSELTFGNGSGLLGAVHEATLNLGHLTIADYLGTGAIISGSHQGAVTLQNSIVSFNSVADLVDFGGALSQTGNFIGGDPLFLNEPLGDYRLSPASPAINTGTPGVLTLRLADLDHGSRVTGGAPDKGCFEFNALFADGFDVGDARSWSGYTP